jgi:hypothetical protein
METLSELEQPHTCTFHLLGCFVFQSDNTYLGPLNWLKDSVAIADNSLESVLSKRFWLCTETWIKQPCTPLHLCWEYVLRTVSKLPATKTQETPFERQTFLLESFKSLRKPRSVSFGTESMGVRGHIFLFSDVLSTF